MGITHYASRIAVRYKLLQYILAIAGALLGAALGLSVARGQSRASATGSASATIIQPMAITVNNALEFGTWDSQEGTNVTNEVEIVPDNHGGTGTVSSTECKLAPQSPTPTQANFTIAGDGGLAFNVDHEVSNVSISPTHLVGTVTIMNSIGETVTCTNGGSGSDNSKSVSSGWSSPMYLGVGIDLKFAGTYGKTSVSASIDEVVSYD